MGPPFFCRWGLTMKNGWTRNVISPLDFHSIQVDWLAYVTNTKNWDKISYSAYFINKICSFNWPPLRNFLSLYLNLAGKDFFADFTSRFPCVRSGSIHALICNDANSKVISGYSMILSAHHFRSHVSRCSRGLRRIIGAPISGDAEIGKT